MRMHFVLARLYPLNHEEHGALSGCNVTLLFTGGLFGVHPNANADYACMSIDKSALRALALMLNAELKDKGIFAGIVEIMGVVGSNEHFAPKNIAEAYWQLYTEKNSFEYIFD